MSIKLTTAAYALFGQVKLSPSQKLVLLALCDHANDEDHTCWPSINHLQKKLGLGRNTIWQAIDALCDAGYVTRVKKGSNGPIPESTLYHINLGQNPTYLGQNQDRPRSRIEHTLGQNLTPNHNMNRNRIRANKNSPVDNFPPGFDPAKDCRPGESDKQCLKRAWEKSGLHTRKKNTNVT